MPKEKHFPNSKQGLLHGVLLSQTLKRYAMYDMPTLTPTSTTPGRVSAVLWQSQTCRVWEWSSRCPAPVSIEVPCDGLGDALAGGAGLHFLPVAESEVCFWRKSLVGSFWIGMCFLVIGCYWIIVIR